MATTTITVASIPSTRSSLTTVSPATIAYDDLQGTWTSGTGFTVTITPGGPGALTTNLGGLGIPTATITEFSNVNAANSVLTIAYNFSAVPNAITVNDGSSTYPAYRAGTTALLDIGGKSEIRPSTIGFSGDSGNIATALVWSHWGSPIATARGVVNIQGCVPDCASGSETPTPVEITVSNLTGDVYENLTESVAGSRPVAYDATQLARLGA
jgi:hypothetical protein